MRVRLVDQTEAHALIQHHWFLESQPEAQTCRPIAQRTDTEVIQRFRERSALTTEHAFSILRIADDQLVGLVRYFDLNTRNRSAEIGFLIGTEFRGQGYAKEAVGLLLKCLFGDLRLNKVYGQTAEFNEASIALMKSLGFHVDGQLRQHHELNGVLHDDLVLSLLASEFQPQ